MQRTKSNFDIDNIDPNYIYNIEESAMIIKSSGLLKSNHINILNELVTNLRANFNGTLSNSDLLNFCNIKKEILYSTYDFNNNSDNIILTLLEITGNSLEWWSTFDERNTVASPKIAPWIGLDAAGAVVGAAIAIARSDKTKPVKAEDVATGALITGLVASTGIVGRIARWTKLW